MGNDLKNNKTKERIKNHFIELLGEIPIHKIKVTTLCELANINRSTFYRYYFDVYDIFEQIETSWIDRFNKLAFDIPSLNVEDVTKIILNDLKENYKTYTVINSNNASGSFSKRLTDVLFQKLVSRPSAHKRGLDTVEGRWKFYFFASGCTEVIYKWLSEGMCKKILTECVRLLWIYFTKLLKSLKFSYKEKRQL